MRALLVLLAALVAALPAVAQTSPARIGAGIDAVIVPVRAGDVDPGVGLGVRGRVALPINADLSAAASAGLSANLAGNAELTATPQVSLIVTLADRRKYLLGGFGGFVPLSGGGGGATIHAGIGTAVPLSETSLYFELNPALVVGSSETTVVIPARVGVIF